MKNTVLEVTVFCCGFATMALELMGSRLLAPYLGTSIYVWTSLIGVILGTLSAGYWFGGFLADKEPAIRVFSRILFLAGLWVAFVAFSCDLMLIGVQKITTNIPCSALLATLILFGVPSLLLGMVLPYSVRLKTTSLDKSGTTVGTLYALSTLGSLLGTFVTGFYLFAFINNMTALLIIAAMLLSLSILSSRGFLNRAIKTTLTLCFIFAITQSESFSEIVKGRDFVDVNTPYNRVWIFKASQANTGYPIRVMQVNDENDSAMFIGRQGLVFDYTKYFRLAKHFSPSFKSALMIGGGAYSYPKDFLDQYPAAHMDVVEIDPAVTRLAEKYFEVKRNPRMRIIHDDARHFLNQTSGQYDVLFVDAFRSFSLPYQLTTKEATQKMYRALNPTGVVLANLVSSIEGDSGEFLRAELATYRAVFSQVYLFPVEEPDNGGKVQNILLIALKSPKPVKFYSEETELDNYLHHVWYKDVPNDRPPLEDNYAPVDRYIVKILAILKEERFNPVEVRISGFVSRFFKTK